MLGGAPPVEQKREVIALASSAPNPYAFTRRHMAAIIRGFAVSRQIQAHGLLPYRPEIPAMVRGQFYEKCAQYLLTGKLSISYNIDNVARFWAHDNTLIWC